MSLRIYRDHSVLLPSDQPLLPVILKLKKYRLQGDCIEGIHWVRINSRCVRYNLELIQDWLPNRNECTRDR